MADMVKTYTYIVDIDNGTVTRTITEPIVSGDNLSRRISITVNKSNTAFDLSTATVKAYVVRHRDNVTVENAGSVSTVNTNYAWATLGSKNFEAPGKISIYVEITIGTTIYTPLIVEANVVGGRTATVIDPYTTIPGMAELLAQISAIGDTIADFGNAVGKKIYTGQISVTADAGSNASAIITYPEVYGSTPKVFVTPLTSYPGIRWAAVSDRTTSGATITVYNGGSSTFTLPVQYLVIGDA